MHTSFTLWMNFHMYRWYVLLTIWLCKCILHCNTFIVCMFMTCSTSYCLVTLKDLWKYIIIMVKIQQTYNSLIKYGHLQTYQMKLGRILGSCDKKNMGSRLWRGDAVWSYRNMVVFMCRGTIFIIYLKKLLNTPSTCPSINVLFSLFIHKFKSWRVSLCSVEVWLFNFIVPCSGLRLWQLLRVGE